MEINPNSQTVSYGIKAIGDIEHSLNEIQRMAIEEGEISPDIARAIIGEMNRIRASLHLQQGIKRHEKFSG